MKSKSHTREFKKKRQLEILEIISNNKIYTQEQLGLEMKKAGYDLTQATLSRDIKQLHLTKVSSDEGRNYYSTVSDLDMNKENKYISVLKEGYRSSEVAQNILVIKTVEGLAMAVAAALDHMNLQELLGCVAGDDTVICVTHNDMETKILNDELRKMLL